MKSSIDTRDEFIKSRAIPEPINCILINENTDFYNDVYLKYPDLQWILIDESQFLTKKQVDEIAWLVDTWDINVICYGLRTDFRTELFPGSKRLFELADTIEEMKTTCSCGKRALINARIDNNGNIITDGEQIECGAEDKYITMCRHCYYQQLEAQNYNETKESTIMEDNKKEIKNISSTADYDQNKDLNISENNISYTQSLNTSDAVYECTSDLNCTYVNAPVLNENERYDGCINPWSCPVCGNYVWNGKDTCPQCGAEKPSFGC